MWSSWGEFSFISLGSVVNYSELFSQWIVSYAFWATSQILILHIVIPSSLQKSCQKWIAMKWKSGSPIARWIVALRSEPLHSLSLEKITYSVWNKILFFYMENLTWLNDNLHGPYCDHTSVVKYTILLKLPLKDFLFYVVLLTVSSYFFILLRSFILSSVRTVCNV